ncbi:MAG: glycoside hydrolase family 2 [Clostridia bacterium]|nr:glycoside hydrolase family 2 [Clostridia bacterium]
MAAQGQDHFARIAQAYQPNRPGLEKCPPVDYRPPFFAPSSQKAAVFVEQSYEQKCAAYWDEIAQLRQKYAPFLRDLTPKGRSTRKRIPLRSFDFRYETDADRADFSQVLGGKGEWERVSIPHYVGPMGKWTAFYRTQVTLRPTQGKRLWLHFNAVDYTAAVYVNGRFVGGHEGFFAPFEFDVTDFVHSGKNTVVVQVGNDYPLGAYSGRTPEGDKVYAATGLGWDDHELGWHHCPPGAGIYNHVYFEERSPFFIESVFVRPDIDAASAETWIQVYNCTKENYAPAGEKGLSLGVRIYPYNFEGKPSREERYDDLDYTGPTFNYYRFSRSMKGFRLWEQDTPYLYLARVSLYAADGTLLDQLDQTFGMRKFTMDETCEGDKGGLYLNNKPIILRGANDMGHMQLAVCNEDWELLITDILIAKVANMNYYRFTQRPVQEEIYHYCDMLGMLNQSDLPTFSYIRRNQYHECVRQTGEMERLIRSHPSSIMVSYINEAMGVEAQHKSHRHLSRPELESFFESCDRAVRLENPDRVIKRNEGDYDPPSTEGLSDFHCYNMWYTNHAEPIGRLYANWLPAIRKSWKTGCGEFGTEGLDSYEVMSTRYPRHWLPDEDGTWLADRIVFAQTNSMHGDWYPEQEGIHNWIAESQAHQALATKLMTDAFRRRSDKVVMTAIHLLIDAWPAGWMKVLVGVDRQPKPAFFEFKNSQTPLRLNLRCDRWTGYCGETLPVECWLLNDTARNESGLRMVATVRTADADIASYELTGDVAAVSPRCAGIIPVALPHTDAVTPVFIDADLYRGEERIHSERFTVEVWPRSTQTPRVTCIGTRAFRIATQLGCDAAVSDGLPETADVLLISDNGVDLSGLDALTAAGCRVLLLPPDTDGGYALPHGKLDYDYIFSISFTKGARPFDDEEGVVFVAHDDTDPRTAQFAPKAFSYLYNRDRNFIDTAAVNYFETDGYDVKPLVFTYAKPTFFDRVDGHKRRLPVAGELAPNLCAVSMSLDGRVGCNPAVDALLLNLMK